MRADLLATFFWPLCTAHRALAHSGAQWQRQRRAVVAKATLPRPARSAPTFERIGSLTASRRPGVRSNSGG
jgi:hypothetical protein